MGSKTSKIFYKDIEEKSKKKQDVNNNIDKTNVENVNADTKTIPVVGFQLPDFFTDNGWDEVDQRNEESEKDLKEEEKCITSIDFFKEMGWDGKDKTEVEFKSPDFFTDKGWNEMDNGLIISMHRT